jgi:nucleolar complex protein 2
LGTKAYHQGLVEEVIHLLFEYYACNCKSIGFPELAVPAVVQLKRMMKNSTDFTKNKHMQQLIEKVEFDVI